MATVKFKRKTEEEIENLAIEDGSIIFDTTNRKMYLDNGTERLEVSGGVSKEYVDEKITGALEASY